MTVNDAEWVEDVRRWYFNGGQAAVAVRAPKTAVSKASAEDPELGYEAAQPSLQSPHWAVPPSSEFGELR